MASTIQKIQGVKALLQKFKKRAESVERHYRGLLRSGPAVEVDRVKTSESDLIEQLIIELTQSITGTDQIDPNIWKKSNPFAHEIAAPATRRYMASNAGGREWQELYVESEAEFFRGLQLWADHTLDYLDYLEAYQLSSTDLDEPAASTHFSASSPEYDLAISFAGEDRATARAIASMLRERGLSVFYDEYEKASLWGRDLYTHLSNIYKNRAQYCLILISQHYRAKLWTRHELRAAQARAFSESREYILPLRIDDTEIEGILPTTAYISMQENTTDEIAQLLIEKIRNSQSS